MKSISRFGERMRLRPLDWLFPKRALERENKLLWREALIIDALKNNAERITGGKPAIKDLRYVKTAGTPLHVWNAVKEIGETKPGEKKAKLNSLTRKLLKSYENRLAYVELLQKRVYR